MFEMGLSSVFLLLACIVLCALVCLLLFVVCSCVFRVVFCVVSCVFVCWSKLCMYLRGVGISMVGWPSGLRRQFKALV